MKALHLVRRFVGMVVPRGPTPDDEAWVAQVLSDAELGLWREMAPADRRHAAGVARRVQLRLGHEATPPVLAAALLHDVGKVDSRLGVYGRVVATLCGMVADDATVDRWRRRRGFTRRVGLYLQHPDIGGDRLELAGSDPLTVAWARQHQGDEAAWTVPRHIGEALRDADDD